MAAQTADRTTPRRGGTDLSLPVLTGVKIFAGSMVAIIASGTGVGFARPGITATTLRGVGVAQSFVDNTAGASGALQVPVAKGVWLMANSAAGDQITAADIGADCFIVDDQTVAKTNGTNTRSVAGKVFDVDASGVWVQFL